MTDRTSWVFALRAGDLVLQDGKRVTVTDADLHALAASTRLYLTRTATRALAAGVTPYRLPVLTEHQRDGQRLGGIVDARYNTAGAKVGLWLAVRWTPEAWAKIQTGRIAHVSVGTVPSYQDETGTTYSPLVWELSVTTHPRVKTLGSIQDTLRLRLSDGVKMSEEDIAQAITALMQSFEAMSASHDAMLARLEALEAAAAEEEMEPAAAAEPAEEEEEMEAAEEEEKEEKEEEEGYKLSDLFALVKDQAAKLDALTRTRGLHLSERGHGTAPDRTSARTETLAEHKARTGLSGAELFKSFDAARGVRK